MAMNTFDALMIEVNQKIAETSSAASSANAAAAKADAAAKAANEASQAANAAAENAQGAADAANNEVAMWEGVTVVVKTVDAGEEASVTLTEKDGKKVFTFSVPRGADGAKGAKGDPGKSGVTFTLSGTKLYITTG